MTLKFSKLHYFSIVFCNSDLLCLTTLLAIKYAAVSKTEETGISIRWIDVLSVMNTKHTAYYSTGK